MINRDNKKKNIKAARLVLMGAICGDIIGSWFESRRNKTKRLDFEIFSHPCGFTDDTICSIGIADALIHDEPFDKWLRIWCRIYPNAGYGKAYKAWFMSDSMEAYNSWGNGSAMRVSAIGAFANSFDEAMGLAKKSAEVTHNHPEGIKGAQAVTTAIHYALVGKSKQEIMDMVEKSFGYDLHRKFSEIQPIYSFDVSCQGSVPEAIICFLESTDYENAIRKAVALGGDSDTQAAITGGIAAAFYGHIPEEILFQCNARLRNDMKTVIDEFNSILR